SRPEADGPAGTRAEGARRGRHPKDRGPGHPDHGDDSHGWRRFSSVARVSSVMCHRSLRVRSGIVPPKGRRGASRGPPVPVLFSREAFARPRPPPTTHVSPEKEPVMWRFLLALLRALGALSV